MAQEGENRNKVFTTKGLKDKRAFLWNSLIISKTSFHIYSHFKGVIIDTLESINQTKKMKPPRRAETTLSFAVSLYPISKALVNSYFMTGLAIQSFSCSDEPSSLSWNCYGLLSASSGLLRVHPNLHR